MVVTSTMSFMVVVSLSGGTWADRASPGAAASVRGCREEREFSTTPHEDGLAREVAPLERKGIGVNADDDAFPPPVLDPDGRQHHAANADFVPVLRPLRCARHPAARCTTAARDRRSAIGGACSRIGACVAVAGFCEFDELAEHRSAS